MSKIIISTESGSDLPYKISVPHNIQIIPMHISFGYKTLRDGSFDIDDIYSYYDRHKQLPKTSAPNPGDYTNHFKTIFDRFPDCSIIHISYSSKLSAAYQNALLASHDFDSNRISIIDSLNASSGLAAVVMLAIKIIDRYHNRVSFEECSSLVRQARSRVRCSFIPESLEYIRAGGRITGIMQFGAAVLNVKPSIAVIDGSLEQGKRYRGNIQKVAFAYMDDFAAQSNLNKDFIIIGYSHGISKAILFALKRHAHKLGFTKSWCFEMCSAVTSHTGPGCIGCAGVVNTKLK